MFGDWPYSTILLNSAQLLIDSINSDSKVSLVLHVGDMIDPHAPGVFSWENVVYCNNPAVSCP